MNYLTEVFPTYSDEVDFQETPTYSLVDSTILHAMIRHHKPKKVVEIGSGETTLVAAYAGAQNAGSGPECSLVAIDPYSKKHLRERFSSNVTLIEKRIEDVAVSDIVDCDLLFIDSSHVIKTGGDVNYEILELVPRLKSGTIIHWHDILLPGEYWKDWVKDKHYYWTEQYLLHAFLKFNHEFEVIWASRYMHLNFPNKVKSTFANFRPDQHRITSFWIRRK
jgi:predicted O-methyltransferase YrrM